MMPLGCLFSLIAIIMGQFGQSQMMLIMKALVNEQDAAFISPIRDLLDNLVNFNLVWTALSLYFALKIYFKSPGYVRAKSPVPSDKQYAKSLQDWTRVYPMRASSLKAFVEKLCNVCKTERPLRSKHCYVCGRCVYKFDHHCSLLSTCIGLKTYREYIGLIFSQCLWCSLSLFNLRRIINVTSWYKDEFSGYILALCLWVVIISSIFLFFCQLQFYHIRLILINATTNEDCRMIYGQKVYPFNAGIWRNMKSFKNKSNF